MSVHVVEVEFLNRLFTRVPAMADFCDSLRKKYCMHDESFTAEEFFGAVCYVLFYCQSIDRLRLNLPFQLVGRHCDAATMILAITFKAFASRSEEDAALLKFLVLENVSDITLCHLWMNPLDVKNIMQVLAAVEHFVLSIRRHEWEAPRMGLFASCLWHIIEYAQNLASLCLVGMDHDDRPPRGLKQTRFWQVEVANWRARALPPPHDIVSNLTCLELRRVEVLPETLIRAAECFGSTLRELYLNEVYLKTEQSHDWNEDSKKILWIGVANERPEEDCRWIAMIFRSAMTRLRICRASFLAYDQYLRDDLQGYPEFDLIDPSGLGRSVSQRFVEIVMGIRQPSPTGEPIQYLPFDSKHDHLLRKLKSRNGALNVTEYDTNAYQAAVDNTTSRWQKSIDGYFPNCNSNTLSELHFIADTACQGMNEIHRRRNEADAHDSLETEYADNWPNNLLNGPPGGAEAPDTT